ncbi:MAG: Mur ligase family protein [Candidatus Nealsonbacteria bacterium]
MSVKKLKIHFIGIGGIGVSALALYYLAKGHQITGSDLASSEIIESLKKKGAQIAIGEHTKKNVPNNVNLVIYSPAVKKGNPELVAHKSKSYPEALGALTKTHFTLAVSGTHGKSTTATMLSLILVEAGLDPTVIVGTKVKEFNDLNCRVGQSKYLVIEADEHFASFLNYFPKVIVLTNIERDHLDFYKNLNNLLQAFKKYVARLPKNGCLIYNEDDDNVKNLSTGKFKSIPYSLKQKEGALLKKTLKVPGEHNIYNALAALTAAHYLNVPNKISFKALAKYQGAWRRFEIKKKKFTIVSDYGHHPTEVRATLKAMRSKWPKKKIWCVFQPHQHQRTYYLFQNFVKAFSEAPIDKIIITDIYDVVGREEKEISQKVDSQRLVQSINKKNITYLAKKNIVSYLKKNVKKNDILLIMGAGDIYEIDKGL